jgi:hypothetical protein
MKIKNIEIPKNRARKTKEEPFAKEDGSLEKIKNISEDSPFKKDEEKPNEINELKEKDKVRAELVGGFDESKDNNLKELLKNRDFLIENINKLKTELKEVFESDSWIVNVFNKFARGVNYRNFDMYEWLLGESKSEYVYIKGQISLLERELEITEESIKEITD